MTLRAKSLNAGVSWPDVLADLGCPPAGRALPARGVCPACRGADMTTYDDTRSGGAWHYCFDCGAAGDTVELAAAAWGLTPAAAVGRLAAAGHCPPPSATAAARYAEFYPAYRAGVADLWRRAAAALPKSASPVVRRLRYKFRLTSTMSDARWAAGPGHFVGACRRNDVDRAFRAGSTTTHCESGHRPFKGRQWGDLLAVPYSDLPGRACGFLFVGREGRPEDHVYQSVVAANTGVSGQAEGGLAGLWAVERTRGQFGGHVAACGDPFLTTRLQIRHYATSAAPLPLVAFCDRPEARTAAAWRALDGRTPVLWGWRLTPALLYQAVVSGGMLSLISLKNLDRETVDHYVRDHEPREILDILIRRARPWRDFLAAWADKQSDSAVAKLAAGAEAYGVDPVLLAEASPRVAAACGFDRRHREVRCRTRVVTEVDGKWWARDPRAKRDTRPELVMNASVRIDRTSVVDLPDNTRVACYTGRVFHDGDVLAFELPIADVAAAFTPVFTEFLALHKAGAVLYVSPSFPTKDLIQIAILLGRPS